MNLIPVPRVFEPTKVRYELPKGFSYYISDDFCALKDTLVQGFSNAGANPTEGDLSSQVRILRSATDNMVDEEYYTLVIDEKGVCVTADTVRGAFYGIMTLFQAARLRFRPAGSIILQGCKISDRPYRSSRPLIIRQLPTIEYTQRLLRYMAYNKMNELHFVCDLPEEYKTAISDTAERCFVKLICDGSLPAKTCVFSHPYIRFRLKKLYLGGYSGGVIHVSDDMAECDFFNFPRLQALAESLWRDPKTLDYFDFECRLQQALQEMCMDGVYYCKPHLFRVSRRYSRYNMRRKLRAALTRQGRRDDLAKIMSSEVSLNEYEDLL